MYPIISEPFLLEPSGEEHPRSDTGILLIHGFTGSPTTMREMGAFFVGKGHAVYSMRIAGHGTHPDDLNRTSIQEWLHSVEDAVHYMRNYAVHIAIVGFSFGGNLAMHAATQFPELVSDVVVMGTPLRLRNHWRVAMNIAMYETFKLPYIAPSLRYRNVLPLVESNGVYTIWPTSASKKILQFLKTHARTSIQKMQQPLFIIQSLDDKIVDPKSALHIYKNAGSSRKEIFWIHNAHHYPLQGSERDEVYKKIHRFITKP